VAKKELVEQEQGINFTAIILLRLSFLLSLNLLFIFNIKGKQPLYYCSYFCCFINMRR